MRGKSGGEQTKGTVHALGEGMLFSAFRSMVDLLCVRESIGVMDELKSPHMTALPSMTG